MRRATWIAVLTCVVVGGMASGCAGEDPASSEAAAAGDPGGGAGGGGGTQLNGCDSASAEDHTGEAAVTVATEGFGYSPACLRVSAGTKVTFASNFASHPLSAGDAASGAADAASPIAATTSGSSVEFTFADAGAFGFYCQIHQPSMAGAVFVE